MNDEQQHALRNALLDTGLDEQKVYDVMLLLRYKPERVQLAFYYVAMGYTHREAADKMGVSKSLVSHFMGFNCEDIRKHLYFGQ